MVCGRRIGILPLLFENRLLLICAHVYYVTTSTIKGSTLMKSVIWIYAKSPALRQRDLFMPKCVALTLTRSC